ncbi:hypothetical protein L1787_11600 [Acuticoccus sp. M5D2P5]|uniref:hypothetical protein n=1 Tax=Acuticoccus kalidii TaxID=2910977 RepID=UPI001F2C7ED0|nr:hypothetical protein [Acuticoccus kalidii]MCF3934063.1 hypothetical protein [Acuticoccus kalidii]
MGTPGRSAAICVIILVSARTRPWVALAAASVVWGLADYLKIYASFALNHGATAAAVREIAHIVVILVVFPRAIMASQAISDLIAPHQG